MLFDEEINLVGIIQEKDLRDTTSKAELHKIIVDALGIAPMLAPLMRDLDSKGLIAFGDEIRQ
jgi:hypothetical protein